MGWFLMRLEENSLPTSPRILSITARVAVMIVAKAVLAPCAGLHGVVRDRQEKESSVLWFHFVSLHAIGGNHAGLSFVRSVSTAANARLKAKNLGPQVNRGFGQQHPLKRLDKNAKITNS